MKKVTAKEREIISRQLGREPENLGGIKRYCPFGKPAVLLTLPFNPENRNVFPTTYWLSCPYLVKEVARLEDAGWIKQLTERLAADEELKQQLEKAHRRYAAARSRLLGEQEEKLPEEIPGMAAVLRESGVGGIMARGGIKCLHTHLADFLAGGENPVGRLVWDKLDWPRECNYCSDDKNGG